MKITMAHGSGGKSSAQLMSDIFGKHFKNDTLDKMEDAAVLEVSGRIAYSTDSFVVTPLVFKGGDIGKLCVCGTVNDLMMMGAVPKYLTCGFIMEEGLDVELLDQIVESMAKQAKEAGVTIVAGDTKVVEGNGGLYINTSGIGIIPEGRDVSSINGKPGDVNNDGAINVSDISKVAAHVKNKKSLTAEEMKLADVNGDNAVTVTDVSKIAAHVKGIKSL